ncbi:MAG: hypothetical protein CVU56_22310 [Deltaproteobacteria bacterium HGW-Deltaproteobacteria-14]|nr:MAG: hypothetical protein CVU56_22310 [Deltaproteobacteria bacterium HGW-Deltaproteobacteria-14]
MRSFTPAALAAVALALVAAAPPAAAMYLTPDLVQIPADRLIANLTRQLDAAPADSPERVRLEIALGRLHAAAWAQRSGPLMAEAPLEVTIERPEITGGPGDANALRGALAYLGGRGGSAGCDAKRVAARWDYTGSVVLEITLAAVKGEVTLPNRAAKVRVISQDVGEDAVAACLAARVRTLDHMPGAATAITARARFTFSQSTRPLIPFYGFGDSHVPPVVAAEAPGEAAQRHLTAAAAAYRRAIAAAPDSALARLGLAWVIDQAGRKDEAIAAYRETFRAAWKQERGLTSLGLGQRPIASEAAAYLWHLLDPDEDAAERAELKAAIDKLMVLPRPVTPIVIPLGAADTLAGLVDPAAAVAFDLDGSGQARPWGWTRPGAGWLVWDQAGDGAIRSGLQLFGGVSFWSFWRDGYQALAALDDDGDGLVSGHERRGLAVWEDRDGDGVSDPGEVADLDALGIESLSTRAAVDADGALKSDGGVTFSDGRVRPTWDWISEGGSPTR